MSDLPTPEMTPLPYNLPPARRDAVWPVLLSWAVILGCVGFVVFRNQTNTKREEKTQDVTAQMQLKLSTRMAIGLKVLGMDPTGKTTADMLKSVDELTKTPELKLRAAILAGELKGGDEARQRLSALTATDAPPDLLEDAGALETIYAKKSTPLDASERERLSARYPYFSRVALSYGLAADVEPRKSLEDDARRITVMLSLAALVLIAAMFVALGLLITAIVLLSLGKIRRAYVKMPQAGSGFLEAFALYMVLFLALGWVLHKYTSGALIWELLLLALIPPAMIWIVLRGGSFEEMRRGLGWYGGRGVLIEVPLGVAGYLAGMPIIAGVLFGITVPLIKYTGKTPSSPISPDQLGGSAGHILMLYALACVIAPVLEETMFRGALFHHLRRRWGWLISAGVVAIIFASIHVQGWTVAPTLATIALVLAAIREWRGSIIASMVAHACNNFIVLSFALMVAR